MLKYGIFENGYSSIMLFNDRDTAEKVCRQLNTIKRGNKVVTISKYTVKRVNKEGKEI